MLLRSTWDYHLRPAEFRRWLAGFAEAGRTLINPPATALWNMEKSYLEDLAQAGVPLPPTRRLDEPTPERIAGTMKEEGWTEAVFKPRIGATAHGLFRVSGTESIAAATPGPGFLQRFLPEVERDGELSLVYIGGEFSHAARKRARPGDFRVQDTFGGTVEDAAASRETLDLAGRALAAVPHVWHYARVDLVETAGGPLLMELELLEPVLFFGLRPEAADRLVELVVGLLYRGGTEGPAPNTDPAPHS
ncbi:MAG: RimK family alpha-L-glutamate ligase [Gemmatimonadales bacterium]